MFCIEMSFKLHSIEVLFDLKKRFFGNLELKKNQSHLWFCTDWSVKILSDIKLFCGLNKKVGECCSRLGHWWAPVTCLVTMWWINPLNSVLSTKCQAGDHWNHFKTPLYDPNHRLEPTIFHFLFLFINFKLWMT